MSEPLTDRDLDGIQEHHESHCRHCPDCDMHAVIAGLRAALADLARVRPIVDAALAWVRHDTWGYVGSWADEHDMRLIEAVDTYRAAATGGTP